MEKVLIAAVALFVWSCKTQQSQVSLAEKLSSDFPKTEQIFSFNNKRDTILVTENKTRFIIPAYTFCDEKDSICLNNNIEIKIKEFYNLSEMVLNKISTLSNNQIIETAGMFDVTVSKNKNSLLIQNNPICIELPSKKKNGFIYFKGEIGANGHLNWTETAKIDILKSMKDTAIVAAATTVVLKNKEYNNIIKATELGWINCDKFLEFDDTTTLFVSIDNDVPKDALCSLVMKNYNSIIPGIMEAGKIKISPIPNNEPVTLFVLYHDGDSYYLDMSEFTISKGGKYELNPIKVTKEELEAKLSKLNKNRNLPL
jgi:hypothetical protein